MNKVKFLFGIHCHQPVGNFEHVFDEAYEKSYLPFIQALDAHPRIKFSVHYSGVLYDWFLKKHPEFIDHVRKLARRGQAEIMTAGYYEPIIPLIPDADKTGQIALSNNFIKDKFGETPRGLWLTERIWEPHLPKILAQAGIEYVAVDDYHFSSAGIAPEKMRGYYITEEEGATLKIFPISQDLRYLIPFKLPEDTIKYLRSLAGQDEGTAAILADDGEKFGIWPGTHKWVFEEGYLEKLLTLLENNADWIEFMTFSEYIDNYPPIGRIYLPAASYAEMIEWSGGFFRNFLVKYPEANNLHKKMLSASQRLQTLKKGKSLIGEREREARLRAAELELYQGQCNCAYWHGVFGGLYLNYLRHAVYEHLIAAENLMDKYARGRDDYAEITVTDFDKDGRDEVILSNSLLNLYISPAYGGALFEMDYKPKNFNLINTLARRAEAYHEKILHAASNQPRGEAGAASIHEIVKVKEAGLEKALVYDWHRRISLLDHFLGEDTDLESFSRSQYREAGDFTIQPYEFMPKRRGNEVSVHMQRRGRVDGAEVKIDKEITLFARQSIVSINYELSNLSKEKLDLWYGCEFNFSLLAGKAPDRYYEIEGEELSDPALAGRGETNDVKKIKLIDKWKGFTILLETDRPADFWRFPIETVSRSESGFEKTYQSSAVFPNWKISLAPDDKWKVKLIIRIES